MSPLSKFRLWPPFSKAAVVALFYFHTCQLAMYVKRTPNPNETRVSLLGAKTDLMYEPIKGRPCKFHVTHPARAWNESQNEKQNKLE